MHKQSKNPFNLIVIVAALGYFVDIYDLILFNIVKRPSLEALGFSGQALEDKGIFLFNMQMIGMLIGGLLWGIWGDKKGRIKVLFGSILMYSAANVANAFVTSIPAYAIIRFIAGVGLAGELGAGITLVNETMTKEKRGYGTMIVVTFGALGAVLAALVAGQFNWQIAYVVGGVLGLCLLALRMGTFESGMFQAIENKLVKKGSFLLFLSKPKRFVKYLACILIGLPVWYVVGLLIALSETFAKQIGVTEEISIGTAIMFSYIGLSAGDLLSGALSQWFKSRKKIIFLYLLLCALLSLVYLFSKEISATMFYALCLLLGIATGYWALFVTIASEQFGTNIRSTVTTTVPNFVRGAVVPITLTYKWLVPMLGVTMAAFWMGVVSIGLAIVSTLMVNETFGKELNYTEEF